MIGLLYGMDGLTNGLNLHLYKNLKANKPSNKINDSPKISLITQYLDKKGYLH